MSLITVALLIQVLLAFSIAEAKLFAWGVNDYGQLGLNESFVRSPTPIPAYNSLTLVGLKASDTYHMAVTASGDVYVAGNNWYGGLALGSYNPTVGNPAKNINLKGCAIYVGKRHGNAQCGNKFYGWGVQAGYVQGVTSGIYPSIITSLPQYQFGGNVTNVMAGGSLSYVTLANGTIFVAGAGDAGILGLGDTSDRPYFVKFGFFDSIPLLTIAPSHAEHVCAISQSYSLYCWGSNVLGQLGIGSTINQTLPTLVTFFEAEYYVVQVTVGLQHTLALTAGGRVFAWGLGENGVLGIGKSDYNSTFTLPVEITSLADKNIIEIVSGLNFNFARTASNTWYSWGAGSGGVLANTMDQDVPVPTLVTISSSYTINQVLTAATSRSAYGWFDPSAPTAIVGPVLINECLTAGLITCDANAHCQDTDRYAICVCDDGYAGVNGQNCVDIDECLTAVCVAIATCANSPGSFSCTCPSNATVGDGLIGGSGCRVPPPVTTTTTANSGTTSSKSGSTTANSGTTSSKSGTTTAILGTSTTTAGTPTTTAGTSAAANSGTPTAAPGTTSSSGNGNSGSTSASGTSGDGSTSDNGSGNPVTGTSSSDSGGATGSPSGNSGSTAKSSTTRSSLYQTLTGSKIVDHTTSSATTGDPPALIINGNNSGGSTDSDKETMIGVLVAFGILIVIVVVVLLYVFMRNRQE